MNNNEAMIEKIRGLLAKAESSEFEEEADLFLKKATELMAKYRIDEALLAAAGKAADDPVERRFISVGTWGIAKGSLIVSLCQAFDCHAVWASKQKGVRRCGLVGHASDLDVVVALFTSLEIQLDRELQNVKGYDKGGTRAARNSFARGWCNRVGTRVESHYKKAVVAETAEHSTGDSESVALVLASREQDVNAKYQEFYHTKPRYRTSRTRTSNYGAYHNGSQAGERANIGATSIGSRGQISS